MVWGSIWIQCEINNVAKTEKANFPFDFIPRFL